jgi:XTP/dITP diphosphohydrolase
VGQLLVIATRNQGKLREFAALMGPAGIRLLSLAEAGIESEHEETGSSFLQNARQKASAYSQHTGLPVLADDSGLEVFALEGRPGVHSARYAGPGASDADRIQRLLAELAVQGDSTREARFVCALAVARRGAVAIEVEEECRGLVAEAPSGRQGFGYDPIFLLPELGRTFAELSPAEKTRYSHRARAVQQLLRHLRDGKFSLKSDS